MAKDKKGRDGKKKAKVTDSGAAGVKTGGAAAYPEPPRVHGRFTKRFPELAQAWDLLHEGGAQAGPLDEKTQRLVKLAIAIGTRQIGPVHSSVRKALAMGISLEELEQVAALAAGSMGLPAAVAAYTWIHEEAEKQG